MQILIRQWPIPERTVAGEEPFTRLIQRRSDILKLITLTRAERPRCAISQGQHVVRSQCQQAMARTFPGVVHHNSCIRERLSRKQTQRCNIGSLHHTCAIAGRGYGRSDIVIIGIRRTRTLRAAAIDKELFKIGTPLSNLGQVGFPYSTFAADPAMNTPSPGKYRMRTRRGTIENRFFRFAAVAQPQRQRDFKRIRASADFHTAGPFTAYRAAQAAQYVARPFQRSHRTIRMRHIRLCKQP